MKKYFVYLIAVAVMAISGCKEDQEQTASAPEQIPVAGIALSNSSMEIEAGSKAIITVTLNPAGASKWYVSWTSSDETVATVDVGRGFGEITAKKAGTTTLTATTADGGHTATCALTVIPKAQNPVTSITLNPNTELDLSHLETGRKILMLASVMPANADNKTVVWSSSNKSVATISADGLLECIGKGSTTITVESDENSAIKESLNIAVTNDDVFIVADFDTDDAGMIYPSFIISGENALSEVEFDPLEMENKTPSAAVEIPRGTGKALHVYGKTKHAEYGISGAQSGPEIDVKLPAGAKLGDYKFLYFDMYFVTAAGVGGNAEPASNWNSGAGWAGAGSPRLNIKMDADNSVFYEDFGGNPRYLGSLTFEENSPFDTNYLTAYTWARGVKLDLSKMNLASEYQNLNTFKIGLAIRSGALNLYMDNFYLKK